MSYSAPVHHTMTEWESRAFGPGNGTIPEEHAVTLTKAVGAYKRTIVPERGDLFPGSLPRSYGVRALTLSHRHVSTRDQVGQIAAPGASMEILPKIDNASSGVRTRLFHMLGVALDVAILAGADAAHGSQNETLLDVLVRMFATALLERVRGGLPRTYLRFDADLPRLRGRLNIARQFSTLAATPSKLACQYDELSADTALNRTMAGTVAMLRPLVRVPDTRRLLNELAFAYAEVTLLPPEALPWNDVQLDRTNARWAAVVDLGRLLATRVWQDTGAGRGGGTALLFDMNRLFEAYVLRSIQAVAPPSWSVTGQGGYKPCVIDRGTGTGSFATKPDILLKIRRRPRLVIDTKWKRLRSKTEDRKRGIAQSDIYQMMAYSRLYETDVLLLYPWCKGCGGPAGTILADYEISDGTQRRILVGTVDVARDDVAQQCHALLRGQIGSDPAPVMRSPTS